MRGQLAISPQAVLKAALAGIMAVSSVAACGAPTSSEVRDLATVPYGLMSPATSGTSAPTMRPDARPRVYLVRDDLLVPVRAPGFAGSDTSATVSAVLDRLAQGPGEEDRDRGLSSALGSDVRLELARLDGATAVIDVQAGQQAPTAGRLPLAVGQVVLTVVSVPGVDRVVLTTDGQPIQAPLPDGALTERALVASDYVSLLAAATPTPATG